MTGTEFEHYVAELLKDIGFEHVELTKASHDNAIDIIAFKDNKSYIFQCKLNSDEKKLVGSKVLRDVCFAKEHTGTTYDIGVIVTNTDFTEPLKRDAHKHGIELWNGAKLRELLLYANEHVVCLSENS